MTPARYTVTSALPYANGPLHIGHIAGAYLPADIYVRYLRLQERDVVFICGSDEHGAAISIQARKEGKTPQEVVNTYHELNKKAFEDFGISFDIYHRTSSELHHRTAQDFFLKLYENGKFILKETEQFFDEEANQFLADRFIVGTCPNCGNENAYGDQCEKCGSSLSPQELINPRSTLSGSKPVLKLTNHWYLPMNEYESWLKSWIVDGHKNDWKSNVYGQCKSWLDNGLQPRAMTRDLDWGVKVPLKDAAGKVLYVWLDAPIGYISATIQWAQDNKKSWEDYWKKEDTRLIHFIGKDNIVFHCIIFPILLKAHGEFILPDNVPANEFLNLEGQKISTSRNWAVWLHQYLIDFPDKKDELRYVLCSISPETKDSEFTWKDYQARVNNELVAILGNFINRAVVLTKKYFDNKIPARGKFNRDDESLIRQLELFPQKISAAIEDFRFREALAELMNLARAGNKYLADNEPWKLIDKDKERTATILNLSLQIAANLAILSEPFLPSSSARLYSLLNMERKKWNDAGNADLLSSGKDLGEAELLFRKIEDHTIDEQMNKLETSKVKTIEEKTPDTQKVAKEEIIYDDFQKLDIRIGTILEAEKIPKTDKLLKLLIDTGIDKRTVVSGIAGSYDPQKIIGQKVSILVNLAPRKIKGIESKGMILMAEGNNGDLSFVSPEKNLDNGSVIS